MTRAWWEMRAWLASVFLKWLWTVWPTKDAAFQDAITRVNMCLWMGKAP